MFENGEYINKRGAYKALNGLDEKNILDLVMASSSLPVLYEPVEIDGVYYKDGGLTDNLPIKPLYDLGIRDFLIVLLSDKTNISYKKFPDAKFMVIRPTMDLGGAIGGTLNFSKEKIKRDIKLGYDDCIRVLDSFKNGMDWEFVKTSMNIDHNNMRVDSAVEKYNKSYESKKGKIDDILNKYNI